MSNKPTTSGKDIGKQTIAERIRSQINDFTRAERQLANAILENYPVSGLGSITSLSKTSKVSNPTIVRLAKKLVFTGFVQLQNALRGEVEATIANPIMRHDRWAERVPDTHLLNRFADAAIGFQPQNRIQGIFGYRFEIVCAVEPGRGIQVGGAELLQEVQVFVI